MDSKDSIDWINPTWFDESPSICLPSSNTSDVATLRVLLFLFHPITVPVFVPVRVSWVIFSLILKSPFLVTGTNPGKCFSGITRPADVSGLN